MVVRPSLYVTVTVARDVNMPGVPDKIRRLTSVRDRWCCNDNVGGVLVLKPLPEDVKMKRTEKTQTATLS